MLRLIPPVTFAATGSLQIYIVPESGRYLIEAAGAQGGGNPAASGGKGARLRGVFQLRAGDIINLVIGQQGLPGLNLPLPEDIETLFAPPESSTGIKATSRGGGGGGGTFIWKNTVAGGWPDWPLLVAGGGGGSGAEPGGDAVVTPDAASENGPGGRNGHGGSSDMGVFYYGGGGGTGWLSPGVHGAGPTYCQGGAHWAGGVGAAFGGYSGGHGGYGGGGGGCFFRSGAGGGGGYSGGHGGGGRTGTSGGGGGSYNAGLDSYNVPGVQIGDGCVKISCVSLPVTIRMPDLAGQKPGLEVKPASSLLTARTSVIRLPQESRWHYLPQ